MDVEVPVPRPVRLSLRTALLVGLSAAWASPEALADSERPPLAEGALDLPEGLRLSAPFPEGVEFRVSCDYAPCNPAHKGTQDPNGVNDHYALDLTVNARGNGFGSDVTAAAPGQVLFAGWGQGRMSIYGRMVVLWHGEFEGEPLVSFYAHLGEARVKEGDWVLAKQPIGRLGGSSRGKDKFLAPHLHFAVYRGARIEGGPVGGRSVRPEPLDGYSDIRVRQVWVAGDGVHDALYVVVDDLADGFELSVPRSHLRTHSETPTEYDQWIYGTEDTWSTPGGYGPRGTHLSTPSQAQRPGTLLARWVPTLPEAGDYRIQAYVPLSEGATAGQAWYRVHHRGGVDACPLDQTAQQGRWVDLCEGRTFHAREGQTLWVELDDVTGSRAPERVALDALRFVGTGDRASD